MDVVLITITPAGTGVALGSGLAGKGRGTDSAGNGDRGNDDCDSFVDSHKVGTLLGTTPTLPFISVGSTHTASKTAAKLQPFWGPFGG